jgi:CubicO group peptidase (beta-lactamase class C family)
MPLSPLRLLVPCIVVTSLLIAGASAPAGAAEAPVRLAGDAQASGTTATDRSQAAAIARIIRTAMREDHLKSVIVKVSVDGQNVITRAFGESVTGVPATTDMHFRNGSVAIGYMANVLLQLVDEGKVSLDDKVSRWLPNIPHADKVTLEQLGRMTSGYQDYVHQLAFIEDFYSDPFQAWTTRQQLGYVADKPLFYEPGTNWNYAHTNYVILGLALEKITGMPLRTLLRTRVLEPLGLDQTRASQRAVIPAPVLHAFSSERREFLGIPDGTPFYEESSFWNPSWSIARGSIQTTDIDDLHTTAIAFGTGALLSRESFKAMTSTDLRGFGSEVPGCDTCHRQSERYSYGVGLVTTGDWVMQNPMFGGYSAVAAYLPSERIAIAVSVTYKEAAFANNGPGNQADALFREIGKQLSPGNAPPA